MHSIDQFQAALGNHFIAADELDSNTSAKYLIVNYELGAYTIGDTNNAKSTLSAIQRAFYDEKTTGVKRTLLKGALRDSVRILFFDTATRIGDLFPLLSEAKYMQPTARTAARGLEGYLYLMTHKATGISMMCFRQTDAARPTPSAFRLFYHTHMEAKWKAGTASETLSKTISNLKDSDFTIVRLEGLTDHEGTYATVRDHNYYQGLKATTPNA